MITSNHLIAHARAHVFLVIIALTPCFLLSIALDSHAMSQSPDKQNTDSNSESIPYTPAPWHEKALAENDASRALANADTRLLAFAMRGYTIPGIDPAQQQAYQAKCGVRFIDGFGDVIRSDEQLEQMKLAREYAVRYNAVIISGCALSE